jgi:hypothetical protein
MAALTGNKIKDSYLGLLKTTNSGILTSSFVRITDGGGNNTQLYLSNTAIRFYDAYTFPSADGTVSGQVLTTDANGALSWADSSDNQTLDEVLTQGNTTDLAILSTADGNTFGSTTFDDAVTGTTANFTTSVTSPDFIGDLNGSVRFAAKMIGSSVLKGQVVYVSGLSGNTPEVQLAKANSTTTMTAVGIAADDANQNASFEVDTLGSARGIDLSDCIETGITLTEGDVLYVSATEAGHLTNVAPTGVANLIQNIGMAIRVDPTTNATIKVMGAGRANALPNLPTGVIVGNGTSAVSASSNLLIASDGTITLYQPNNVPSDIKNYNIGGGNIALNTDGFNTGFGEGNLSQVGFVGSNNSAFGYQSSFAMTTGDNNTSVGFSSLFNETVGDDNTAIGHYSLFYSNNGNYNTAIGSYSLYTNSSGGQNVALGYEALRNNTTSSHNAALGYRALKLSTGDHNLGVGYNSGSAIVTGNNNVVIGSNTGSTIDGLSNRIIISDGAANIRQLIDNLGKLQMPSYGSASPHTGTLAKTLAVDSSGYVIEVDATTGTVTSVALSVPTGLTVTNSPITTSGTITIGGTLGVANGGTGATTLTGILVGNGTSAISSVTDGTVGQVLSTDASGTYSFANAATGDVSISGTPSTNEVAIWTDSNTIKGDAAFKFVTGVQNSIKLIRGTGAGNILFYAADGTTLHGYIENQVSGNGLTIGQLDGVTSAVIDLDDSTITFKINTTPKLTISSGGLATFTPTGGNGTGAVNAIHLKNTGAVVNDGTSILFTAGTSADGAAIKSTGQAFNSSDLRFFTGGSAAANERLTISSGGDVGIGNNNPAVPLDITSNSAANALRIRARTQNDYGFMSFYNNAGTAYWGEIYYAGSATAGSSLNFTVGSGVPKLTISSTGNVGIGTTTTESLSKLNVSNASSGAITRGLGLYNVFNGVAGTGVSLDFYVNVGVNDRCARIISTQSTAGNYADLQFQTSDNAAPATRLTISSGGLATFSNGIQFGTGDTLGAYEQDTYSPILKGASTAGSSPTGVGTYTVIGNVCHLNIRFSGVTVTGATGAIAISLPFAGKTGATGQTTTNFNTYNVSFTGTNINALYVSGDVLYGLSSVSGTTWADWAIVDASNIYWNLSITYLIN